MVSMVSIVFFYFGFLPQPQVSHIAGHLPVVHGQSDTVDSPCINLDTTCECLKISRILSVIIPDLDLFKLIWV